jgi:hypothetical protein
VWLEFLNVPCVVGVARCLCRVRADVPAQLEGGSMSPGSQPARLQFLLQSPCVQLCLDRSTLHV